MTERVLSRQHVLTGRRCGGAKDDAVAVGAPVVEFMAKMIFGV
jgi:hypothetical protein